MEKNDLKLEQIRHSLSHFLAWAVKDIFQNVKFGIGPTIENGFYYDFDLEKPIKDEDLPKIEKRIKELIKKNIDFKRIVVSAEEAKKKSANQPYKLELINELAKQKKQISYYKSDEFEDLCEGPHVANSKEIPLDGFKLIKVAGAYWRGSEKNQQLQRIYGVAFESKKDLDNYLKLLAEVKKRDHRKLGEELELFHISKEVGTGLPLWTSKGTIIRKELEKFLTKLQVTDGYLQVMTPHIGKLALYKKSGHWQNYRESMYSPIKIEDEEYVLKPMNCPHHIEIYNSRPRSYRELPIRLAEFGTVYRYEKSGELSGLVRVRGFTIDDAHIFCRADQLKEEFAKVIDLIKKVFAVLNFKDFKVRIGLKDPASKKYVGTDEQWKKAEKEIEEVVKTKKVSYNKEIGEAAFYGPKLDFIVKDVLGRAWQLGTIQVDYNLPSRFNLEYNGQDGKKYRPVMIHRAPFGSLERFVGIMIEHFAGAFPVWLSPIQVYIIPVGKAHFKFAEKIGENLQKEDIRCEVDLNRETVGYKIRKSEKMKVPYMLVIGDKEMKGKFFNVRIRGQKAVKKMTINVFEKKIKKEIELKH